MIANFGTLTLASRVKIPKLAITEAIVPYAGPATPSRRPPRTRPTQNMAQGTPGPHTPQPLPNATNPMHHVILTWPWHRRAASSTGRTVARSPGEQGQVGPPPEREHDAGSQATATATRRDLQVGYVGSHGQVAAGDPP
jgi:hypothetical protein